MVGTDHSRDLPGTIFLLPRMNKPPLALTNLGMARVIKTMHTSFQRTVSLHIESLKSSRYELTGGLPANILLYAFGERLSPERHAALVVIELHVVDEE